MLYYTIIILAVISVLSCKQKAGDEVKPEDVKTEDQLIRTKEFKEYVFTFFNLTGPNVSRNNDYVQKFMIENKLLKFKDICDLLKDEKIQSDSIVYNHWKVRCDFQNAKNTLMDKYGLTSDSINKVLRRALQDPPEFWHLEKLNQR